MQNKNLERFIKETQKSLETTMNLKGTNVESYIKTIIYYTNRDFYVENRELETLPFLSTFVDFFTMSRFVTLTDGYYYSIANAIEFEDGFVPLTHEEIVRFNAMICKARRTNYPVSYLPSRVDIQNVSQVNLTDGKHSIVTTSIPRFDVEFSFSDRDAKFSITNDSVLRTFVNAFFSQTKAE